VLGTTKQKKVLGTRKRTIQLENALPSWIFRPLQTFLAEGY
jgi:hypothetical protein